MSATEPPHSQLDQIIIRRGSVLIYRVFDVAEEIDLMAVERALSQGPKESRVKLSRGGSSAVVIRNAPVRLSMGEVELRLGGRPQRADVVATVWDYGVFSILFQVPIPSGTEWKDLLSFSTRIYEASEIDEVALQKSKELARLLKTAIKGPGEWPVAEDYVIYFFEDLQGITSGLDLTRKADLPALILGEPVDPLSDKIRDSLSEHIFQYAANDLVLIDWNSAVVLEPSGQRDIPDVLEFALTHLLELRYYDDLLDRRLADLYDSIEERKNSPFRSQFGSISREASSRFIEFSEFIERVDNSLKVVGDFYLATIFRGAVRRFRIMDWQQSITRKMNLMARVSDLLQGEVNVFRGHLLEIIIILLIAFEILSAMYKSGMGH